MSRKLTAVSANWSATGLLRRDEQGNFDLHPLVRGYAYERARNKQSLHERLGAYYKRSLDRSTLPPRAEVERLTAAVAFFYHTCRSGKYQERAGDKEGARNLNKILWYELGQCSEFILIPQLGHLPGALPALHRGLAQCPIEAGDK